MSNEGGSSTKIQIYAEKTDMVSSYLKSEFFELRYLSSNDLSTIFVIQISMRRRLTNFGTGFIKIIPTRSVFLLNNFAGEILPLLHSSLLSFSKTGITCTTNGANI